MNKLQAFQRAGEALTRAKVAATIDIPGIQIGAASRPAFAIIPTLSGTVQVLQRSMSGQAGRVLEVLPAEARSIAKALLDLVGEEDPEPLRPAPSND